MSVTLVGGVNNARVVSGLLSVPLDNLSDTQHNNLQGPLSQLTTLVMSGAVGFANIDTVAGSATQATVKGAINFLEITNTDSLGAVTAGSVRGAVTLPGLYEMAIVQAPGDFTVAGGASDKQTVYVLGANSNVSLSSGTAGQSGTDQIVAGGGNDTLDMHGPAAATISGGNDVAHVFSQNATINATGNASVRAGIRPGYAGKMEFINGSSASTVVVGGAGSATVFAGNAGTGSKASDVYGGTSGSNLLIGGTRSAVLSGGGNNDTVLAGYSFDSVNGTASVAANSVNGADYLFAGAGNETLLASSATGSNLFQAGSGADVISTDGSGTQNFFGGVGSATMTGSTQAGAQNVYFFGGTGHAGGNEVITNFSAGRDALYAIANQDRIQTVTSIDYGKFGTPSTLLTLTDNTNVTLVGVQASSLQGNIGGSQIT